MSDVLPPYEPPVTPTERRLAAIWAEVLGLERVGRRDNFFDLGAQSLHHAQLAARVRAFWGVELSQARAFSADSTLAGLAAELGPPGGGSASPPEGAP